MRRNKRLTVMLVLVILVMCLTVGYAVLSTTLNINGTSTIGNARWDIHFENIQVKEGSVTASTAAVINSAKDTVTYVINLAKPGDYYEFTVDVRNAGTIDGMVESITSKINNQPISNKPVYLDYYVTYNDGIEIEPNHLLTAGTSEKIKVHVGFSTDISADDLPGTSQTYSLSLSIKETQATSDAVAKPVYKYSNYAEHDYIGDIIFEIGNPAPSIVPLYDNYADVLNNGANTIFMRHVVSNNTVTYSNVGFYKNGRVYIIEATKYSELTQEMKNTIIGMFGADKCTDTGSSLDCSDFDDYSRVTVSSDSISVDGVINDRLWFCLIGFNSDPNQSGCSLL